MIAKVSLDNCDDRATTPTWRRQLSIESFVSLEQRIKQWIRAYPEMSLALAAGTGMALGWLIKPAR